MVKNLPAVRETWVPSLSWEDPLEEGMATLQHSCLENSMDRGAWRAAVHGVTKESDRTERVQDDNNVEYLRAPQPADGTGSSSLLPSAKRLPRGGE